MDVVAKGQSGVYQMFLGMLLLHMSRSCAIFQVEYKTSRLVERNKFAHVLQSYHTTRGTHYKSLAGICTRISDILSFELTLLLTD